MQRSTLGIDIGRVIIGPISGGRADTSFLSGSFDRAMQTAPCAGAFASIRRLFLAFGGQVYLVSKAGSTVQDKTWGWLRHHDFYEATGLRPKHVRFCRERHEKAGHCNELGITHFVDDRLDVLHHLEGVVANRYLFGEQPRQTRVPEPIVWTRTWEAAEREILATVRC